MATRPEPHRDVPASGPLARELVVVSGKGGVGKSTVAAAIGLAAAQRGRRAIVVEVARRDDVRRAFAGADGAGAEPQLAPGLHHLSIDPALALREYLADQLPSRTLAMAITANGALTAIAEITPGLAELLTLGKVWELAQKQRRAEGAEPYDVVVLDAPASGHAVAMLAAPAAFARLAGSGRVARQAAAIDALVRDPARCAVVAVARPEQLAIDETIELDAALRASLGRGPALALLNACAPARVDPSDAAALARAAATSAPARVALAALRRVEAERACGERLRAALDAPVAGLPRVGGDALDGERLAALAEALEPVL